MGFQLELPDIGEGVVEAEVQRWFVQPGDEVAEDQPLVEVMTDKATVVIPSPRSGRVLRLFWKVGDLAKVHAPLVELETADAPRAPAAPATGAAPRAAAAADPRRSHAPAPAEEAMGSDDAARRKALATPA